MTDAAAKLDRGETMAAMWEGFAEAVIPFTPPGSTQYEEMRKAFYAGALCLFNWFMVQLDPGDEATEADLSKVDAMEQEIRAFITRRWRRADHHVTEHVATCPCPQCRERRRELELAKRLERELYQMTIARRCESNLTDQLGNCAACGAANGEACRKPKVTA